MSLRKLAGSAVALALAAAVTPAGAAPAVAIGTVTVEADGSALVTGTATFEPVTDAVSVGGVNTQFEEPEVAGAAGIDLRDALIQPLADGSGLRFIWQLASLPPTVAPEGVRYTWSFAIGQRQYQLQAKLTNLASSTTAEAPLDHAQQVQRGSFFQLRGACVTAYLGAPISGCYHLAFLTGAFDYANARVSIDLPYRTRDAIGRLVAEDFVHGVALIENLTAGMSIAASFQAVVSNATVSDYTNGWNAYYVGPQVALAVGSATANPLALAYAEQATITGETFSGTVSGLGGTKTTVFARACNGTECSYASLTP